MTREEIIAKVNSVLAEEFEVEESTLTPDARNKNTLALDSLTLVDLVAIIQTEYRVKIPAEDLPKIQTFNDLYDYIEAHA